MGVRPLHALAGMMCAFSLAGCASGSAFGGFTPMYAVPGLKTGLANIELAAPSGRTAFLLRQALQDALVTDPNTKPAYRLNYSVKQTRVPRGLRVDNVANRYEITTTVAYTLLNLSDRKALTRGAVAVNITSDFADRPYAGVAAQTEADERSADEAALRLRNALAAYFANPTDFTETPTVSAADRVDQQSISDRLGAQDITRDPEQEAGLEPRNPPDGIERIPTQPAGSLP